MPAARTTGTGRFLTDFVPHPLFDQDTAEATHVSDFLAELACRAEVEDIADVLRRTPHPPSPELEQYLFISMNWDRYRLHRSGDRSATRRLADGALAVRNWIVAANQGLVFSLARQIAGTYSHFEELAGEGWFPLIRACELFDATRQFRFSTYATHAIRNHLHRHSRKLQPSASVIHDEEDLLHQFADHRSPGELTARHRAALANRVLDEMSGLPEPASYTQIGGRIGLSKERVRQLALEALDTLRGRLECALPDETAYTVTRPFDRESVSRLLQSGRFLKHASL
jgi:RNA polymerase sigma factor (sigma-70 family)